MGRSRALTQAWQRYALAQLRDAQRAAREVGVPIHLWPDEQLATNAPTAEQRVWCEAWRDRPSPEAIGDGEAYSGPFPEPPAIYRNQRLDEVTQS